MNKSNEISKMLAIEYLIYMGKDNPTPNQLKEVADYFLTHVLNRKLLNGHVFLDEELAYLYLAMLGKDSKAIASTLKLSSQSLILLKNKLIHKLKAKNIVQAVSIAFKEGHLMFPSLNLH